MSAIAPWFLGKNLSITATPQSVATDGTLSDASPVCYFTGVLDESGQSASSTYATENISPIDCGYTNPVDFEISTTYTLTEILQALAPAGGSGTTVNGLNKLSRTSKYAKLVLVWKDNASSAVLTETAYVRWTQYGPTYRKGKNTASMTFVTIAVGTAGSYTANPAFS